VKAQAQLELSNERDHINAAWSGCLNKVEDRWVWLLHRLQLFSG
jgi:hypothetical protein